MTNIQPKKELGLLNPETKYKTDIALSQSYLMENPGNQRIVIHFS